MKNTGGPAFPGYDIYGDGEQHLAGHPHGGMTLRDYFAAKAMQGMYASDTEVWFCTEKSKRAKDAYEMADAMLEEREK